MRGETILPRYDRIATSRRSPQLVEQLVTVPSIDTVKAVATALGAGNQTLTAPFTPSDTARYNPVSQAVTATVNKPALSITANNASKTYGTAIPSLTASYSGLVSTTPPRWSAGGNFRLTTGFEP